MTGNRVNRFSRELSYQSVLHGGATLYYSGSAILADKFLLPEELTITCINEHFVA